MISLHPLYYNATTNNNYALLHMTEDFVLGPSVDVICLPKQPTAITEADFFQICNDHLAHGSLMPLEPFSITMPDHDMLAGEHG